MAMQADNNGNMEDVPKPSAVDNFRSQRLKRGDSERLVKYVYQEGDYHNTTTDGGRLEGEGFSMRDDTTSPSGNLSTISSGSSYANYASTAGIATILSGVTAEGEAMRHGDSSFGTQTAYLPQREAQFPPQQHVQVPQIQPQVIPEPQVMQHSQPQPQRTHQHDDTSISQSTCGTSDDEPVTPKATGYQQPFFSRRIKGVDR